MKHGSLLLISTRHLLSFVCALISEREQTNHASFFVLFFHSSFHCVLCSVTFHLIKQHTQDPEIESGLEDYESK